MLLSRLFYSVCYLLIGVFASSLSWLFSHEWNAAVTNLLVTTIGVATGSLAFNSLTAVKEKRDGLNQMLFGLLITGLLAGSLFLPAQFDTVISSAAAFIFCFLAGMSICWIGWFVPLSSQ